MLMSAFGTHLWENGTYIDGVKDICVYLQYRSIKYLK